MIPFRLKAILSEVISLSEKYFSAELSSSVNS